MGGIKAFVNNIARKGQTRKRTRKRKSRIAGAAYSHGTKRGAGQIAHQRKVRPISGSHAGGTFKAQEHTVREDLQTALEKHIELWMKE
ncbi:MAG: hypothetical protein ACLR78_14110 [Roseburia sp.]